MSAREAFRLHVLGLGPGIAAAYYGPQLGMRWTTPAAAQKTCSTNSAAYEVGITSEPKTELEAEL